MPRSTSCASDAAGRIPMPSATTWSSPVTSMRRRSTRRRQPLGRSTFFLLVLSLLLLVIPTSTLAQSSSSSSSSAPAAAPTNTAGTTTSAAPTDSVCARYATIVFPNETDKQYQLIKLLINTAFAGNYSSAAKGPNSGAVGSGILVEQGNIYNGNQVTNTVNLLQYFNGSLLSTNRNGMPTSVNFLDSGGVAALRRGVAANDPSSNQYALMQHLYSFFAFLLECAPIGVGNSQLKAYNGSRSMGATHKYMDLSKLEWDFFVQQLSVAANAVGFTDADITLLTGRVSNFYARCSPAFGFPESADVQAQSICTGDGCAASTAPNANCNLPDSNGTGGVRPQRAPTMDASSGGGGASAGAIAGGVVGGLAGLGIVLFLAWFLLRRKNRKQQEEWHWQQQQHQHHQQMMQQQQQQQQMREQYGPHQQQQLHMPLPPPASILMSHNQNSPALSTSGPNRTGYFNGPPQQQQQQQQHYANEAGFPSRSRGTAEETYQIDSRPSISSPTGGSSIGGAHQPYFQAHSQPSSIAHGGTPNTAGGSVYHDSDDGPSSSAFASPVEQQRQQHQRVPSDGAVAIDMQSAAPPMYEHDEGAGFMPAHMAHIPRDIELPPEEAQRLIREAQQARMAALAQQQPPPPQGAEEQQQQPQQQQRASSSSSAPATAPAMLFMPTDQKDPGGPSS